VCRPFIFVTISLRRRNPVYMSYNGTSVGLQDPWNAISILMLDIDHITWRTAIQRRCNASKHHKLNSFSSFPHSTCYYQSVVYVIVVMDTTNVCCMTTLQAGASRDTFYGHCSTSCSQLGYCCSYGSLLARQVRIPLNCPLHSRTQCDVSSTVC